MKVYHSDTFQLPLPDGHRFPMRKYGLLRERLLASDFRESLEFCVPPAATDEQLLRVHSADYLQKLTSGNLSPLEQRRIGFPWSPEMVERSRRSTGATIEAARAAVRERAAAHLAGGTHHAFADHGQGFCVFNDVAVAVRTLQAERSAQRAVIIDLDVHQGNGTAAIFQEDPHVFTFSMHGRRNFPFTKCDGDLDIALPDGTGDGEYLGRLQNALDKLPLSTADIVFYLAGADPFQFDRYGKLKLTKAGLADRDRLVIRRCTSLRIPVAVVMAGGYAESIQDIVDIHVQTIRVLVGACHLDAHDAH